MVELPAIKAKVIETPDGLDNFTGIVFPNVKSMEFVIVAIAFVVKDTLLEALYKLVPVRRAYTSTEYFVPGERPVIVKDLLEPISTSLVFDPLELYSLYFALSDAASVVKLNDAVFNAIEVFFKELFT